MAMIPASAAVGYPQCPHHALVAGVIGGYFIWGRYTSINYQIVLYLTSRVLVALFQRLIKQQERPLSSSAEIAIMKSNFWRDRMYSIGAASVWGIVMYLFEDSPQMLHPSLKTSMDEIYRFRPWSSLVPATRDD
jgi:peroxisomal membrane protein 4